MMTRQFLHSKSKKVPFFNTKNHCKLPYYIIQKIKWGLKKSTFKFWTPPPFSLFLDIYKFNKQVVANLPNTCNSKISMVVQNSNLHYREMILTKKDYLGHAEYFLHFVWKKVAFLNGRGSSPPPPDSGRVF